MRSSVIAATQPAGGTVGDRRQGSRIEEPSQSSADRFPAWADLRLTGAALIVTPLRGERTDQAFFAAQASQRPVHFMSPLPQVHFMDDGHFTDLPQAHLPLVNSRQRDSLPQEVHLIVMSPHFMVMPQALHLETMSEQLISILQSLHLVMLSDEQSEQQLPIP